MFNKPCGYDQVTEFLYHLVWVSKQDQQYARLFLDVSNQVNFDSALKPICRVSQWTVT